MLQENGASPLPFFFVGKSTTNDRITRFMNSKHALLSNAMGKPETRAIWYSRDHIAQLLTEIDNAGGDGMRIYFGEHSSTEDYPGQLCLLMVLTKQQGSSHKDITIEDSNNFSARSLEMTDGKTRDFNCGSPCPPICDEEGMDFPQ